MWNHPSANLESRPSLSYSEMSALVRYLWSLEDRGDEYRVEWSLQETSALRATMTLKTGPMASGCPFSADEKRFLCPS
jgi:hypothetical protein